MKKTIFTVMIAIVAIITLESFQSIGFGKKDGTEPGYTGSPGDSLRNCTVCHGGTAYPIDGWITSNVPSGGFIPGATYTITATNTEVGATRFGFSISPQNLMGNLLGKLIITDTLITKLVGDEKYVTYKADGVDGVDSRSWSFDWTAPDSVNEVVFYGAFNSNFDGHKEGDKTFLSQLKLFKQGYTGIAEKSALSIQLYPNPATQFFELNYEHKSSGQLSIKLFNSQGQLVKNILNDYLTTQLFSEKIDVSDISQGLYFIQVESNQQTFTKQLIIK
jgi:hypothetical protein